MSVELWFITWCFDDSGWFIEAVIIIEIESVSFFFLSLVLFYFIFFCGINLNNMIFFPMLIGRVFVNITERSLLDYTIYTWLY